MGKGRRQRRASQALALAEPSNVVPIAPAAPAGRELGITGTPIFDGRIYAESNPKLQWEEAYGAPGAAEWGQWQELERTDPSVATALNLIGGLLRDATPEVEAGEEDERGTVIADFVRDNLQEWLEPRWPQLIEQTVRYGLGYGFALHEVVLATRRDERVPGGEAVYLKKLAQRLPSSLSWNAWQQVDGELHHVVQSGTQDGKWVTDIRLPADKLLLATWNRDGDNYAGFSAFRPVWYLGTIRQSLLKILAIGHARESLGVPVFRPEANTPDLTQVQITQLQLMAENIQSHEKSGMVLPKGVVLEWVFSPGANKSHVLETWRQLGIAILETVQAQQVALGTGETGSRAVGEVHDGTRVEFAEGVRAWIESVWNGIGEQPYTGILRKLVRLNFGEQRRYPRLKLVPKKGKVPIAEFATSLESLVRTKAVVIRPGDESDIRERMGMAPVEVDEAAAVAATPAQPGSPTPVGVDALAVDPSTALNGAQVASLLEIIKSVARGELPRASGVAMILAAFPVTNSQAEKIMGAVGAGFTPTVTPAPSGAFSEGQLSLKELLALE